MNIRIIALAAVLLSPVQAEAESLTLACKGTETDGYQGAKPEPVSMGIVLNFTTYTVQGFGLPGVIDYPIRIVGINDAGQIVGSFANPAGRDHGFLDSGGTFTAIDVPGADYTFAYGINDGGQIVGA